MKIFKKLFSFFQGYQVKEQNKGFTLLELLIVIAILAVLATIVVLVLNPGETLAKSRDTQRMSDMATVKSALSLYLTTVASPTLGASGANTSCKTASGWAAGDLVHYSYPSDAPGAAITDDSLSGGTGAAPADSQATNTNLSLTSGSGWIPVILDNVVGGSPISNLPIDPVNTVTNPASVVDSDLVYRYACYFSGQTLSFELNANLESAAFATASDAGNKEERDGGNNASLYEVGTKLDILSTGL